MYRYIFHDLHLRVSVGKIEQSLWRKLAPFRHSEFILIRKEYFPEYFSLALTGFIQLINILYTASQLLVKV